MPVTYTPLRYPGGKSSLYPLVLKLLHENNLIVSKYVEPFAGGAGLAIKLLLCGEVDSIVLNDLDPAIACFWDAVAVKPDDLIDFIKCVNLDLVEWDKQRAVYKNLREKALNTYYSQTAGSESAVPTDCLSDRERFELACAAFYMNRTNRSGIMAGGPIGGKSQTGSYKIDARFKKPDLIRKIESIARRSASIEVYNYDAQRFIETIIPELSDKGGSDVFVYFDPPYVDKGPGLYQNSLTEDDHSRLAKLICECSANWMVTYDACTLTKKLYGGCSPLEISIGYSAYEIKRGKEILVLSEGLELGMPAMSAAC